MVDTQEYTIEPRFRLSHNFSIHLYGSAPLSASELGQLTLYVCDQPLHFRDSSYSLSHGNHEYTWTDPSGVDWSTHAARTLYISRDQVAPAFESATVNGTTLEITFSEDLGAADSLANTSFTVKKTPQGGAEETVSFDSAAPVISGRTVTLTLASEVTSTDSKVKVTYAAPTSGTANRIVDASGNETEGFTDQFVANPFGALVSNLGQAEHRQGDWIRGP